MGNSVEDVKKYWNDRPCNIKHSNKPIGSKEFFDEVTVRKYFVEAHILRFADFSKWAGKRILEIGCGIGTDTMSFAKKGAQVTAVDLSGHSLSIARDRAQLYGYNVTFVQANAEELSWSVPVETYDLVYSFGVIHHTPHPCEALSEIKRYMGSHSELRMMVYHKMSWKVLWILLRYGKGQFWKLDQLIAENSEANFGCPVTYTYTKESLQSTLELLGYEVTDMWVDHIFPFKVKEYKQYIYKKNWYFRILPAFLFRMLERTFGWHLCVTARLAK